MKKLQNVLASDVLNSAIEWKGKPSITDSEILANCQTCSKSVQLSKCKLIQGTEPAYNCRKCGSTLMVISEPGCGRGYRLGDFVLVPEVQTTFRGVVLPPADKERVRPI